MKTPIKPPTQEELETLQALRERLTRMLFETEKPDLISLLAHGLRTEEPTRPSAEQLLKPLQAGLKKFHFSQ